MSRATGPLALLVLTLGWVSQDVIAEPWTKGRMNLYYRARTPEPLTDAERKGRLKPAREALDVAEKQLATVERDLKKQHGGKREGWPEEARAAFERAREAKRQAAYRWLDLAHRQKDLESWTESMRRLAFNDKKVEHLARAAGPEDADLVVELVRFSIPDDFLCLRITPGGRLDASRLAGTQFEWLPPSYVTQVHAFTVAEPHWEIEVKGESWGRVGPETFATGILGGFVIRYWDVFVAARRQP